MLMSFLLLGLGLFVIMLEFYLPGGLLGLIGGIIVFISIISFASVSGSVLYTILYIIAVVILSIFLVKFILKNIQYGKVGRNFYLDKDQEGFVASSWDKNLVGKKGVVSSDLKPGGHIMIEGTKYQAISQSGYLPKGDEVIVVDGEGDSLLVKKP